MGDIINANIASIEDVLKSDPNIRHLLDVACPLYIKDKLKIKAVLIVCKSYSIRKTIVDLLKSKLDIQAFKNLDLDFGAREGDVVARITQTPEKGFLLCEETELKLSESVRKLLARIIEDSSFDMQIGKGTAAKSFTLDLPDITFVFSCEQKTPATDFLAKYCDHVIFIDDYKVEELCELLIAASFNEKKIKCSPEIIKSIALRNKKDVDLCLRSVLRISQFMELQESADRTLTRSILEKVEGEIYHTFTIEHIRELKQLTRIKDWSYKMKRSITDIHMHIIPGVDDGAIDFKMSLEMIEEAYKQGVRNIFCTSHNVYEKEDIERYKSKFFMLKKMSESLYHDLNLFMGCELLCAGEYMEDILYGLEIGVFLPLGGSEFVLTELYSDATPDEAKAIANVMIAAGWKPILAHTERYPALFEGQTLQELIALGAMIQVNLYSLEEERNENVKERARRLVNSRLAHFIGSDAHRTNHRPPEYETGIRYLEEHCEKDYCKRICSVNAERLLIGSVKKQI